MSYRKQVDDIWIRFNIVYKNLLELDDNTPATLIDDYLDLDERSLKLIAINPSSNGGFQDNGSFSITSSVAKILRCFLRKIILLICGSTAVES